MEIFLGFSDISWAPKIFKNIFPKNFEKTQQKKYPNIQECQLNLQKQKFYSTYKRKPNVSFLKSKSTILFGC